MSLEREIEDLFAVDPSPEFAAKVRGRLAAEPSPARWRFGWMLAPAGAAIASIVVAVLMWPASERVAVRDEIVRPVAPAIEIAAVPAVRPAPAVRPHRETRAVRAPAPPAVLVSAEEVRAFRVLLARVEQGRIPEIPPTEATGRSVDGFGPPWIEIAPVVITPIAQLVQPEGELQ